MYSASPLATAAAGSNAVDDAEGKNLVLGVSNWQSTHARRSESRNSRKKVDVEVKTGRIRFRLYTTSCFSRLTRGSRSFDQC